MATVKKRPSVGETAMLTHGTGLPKGPPGHQEQPQAPAATSEDPGPPPRMPRPPGATAMIADHQLGQLEALARATASWAQVREAVAGYTTLRSAPEVHAYRAELLDWLDAMARWSSQ